MDEVKIFHPFQKQITLVGARYRVEKEKFGGACLREQRHKATYSDGYRSQTVR
jgi:hypothetical protein